MASERDFELLDDYLRHQLNEGDKAAFEQQLEADPTLKNEYKLQHQIAEGLRQARVADLKSMLNSIPVPPATQGTSVLSKLGIGIAAAVVIGLGIYYFMQNPETPVEPQPVATQTAPDNTPTPTSPENQPALDSPATITAVPEVINTVNESRKTTAASTKSNKTKPQEKPIEKPVIQAFDPSEENVSESNVVTEVDKTEKAEKAPNGISIPVETIANNKKYSFHYQFKEGKLVLYGSFENNLYYIMEFFSDNKPTRFLFYKDNYYLLEDLNDKVKPLHAINDPALLSKLRASRAN